MILTKTNQKKEADNNAEAEDGVRMDAEKASSGPVGTPSEKNGLNQPTSAQDASKNNDEQLLQPLSITRQYVFHLLAQSMVGHYCDKLLPIITAIKLLMEDPNVGKQPLKDHYGPKYQEMIMHLNKAQFLQLQVKKYYDGLDPKIILKTDLTSQRFQNFSNAVSNTPFIDKKIIQMFYTITKKTTLKDMSVPAEYLARAYQTFPHFEFREEETKIKTKTAQKEIPEE